MPARPVWNGVITFGMVTIPVGLLAATEEKDIHFHQLHKNCGARVHYQKVCPVHEKVLSASEIERGYEVSKGNYVVITDQDLESLPIPTRHTLEVSCFVKIDQVDPTYFDRSYYIEPEKVGAKSLQLMKQALIDRQVAALGKIALRNRETLCLIRPTQEVLILEMLHWPDEIRKPATQAKAPEVDANQLKMAKSLIDLMAGDFEPEQYEDEFRKALLEKIEAKQQGQTIIEPESEPTKVIDLMEALRASVEAAKGGKKKSA